MEPRFRAPSLLTDGKGFVSDADRDQVFHVLRSQPENRFCFDCAGRNNTWISATFGIFLCMTCSGQHRNLGARVSFVRSTDLDRIKLDELLRMELGGNARARTFFRSHGVPEGRPSDYRSKICERYRKALDKELAETLEKCRPDLSAPWRAFSPSLPPSSSVTGTQDAATGEETAPHKTNTNEVHHVAPSESSEPPSQNIVAGVAYESGAGAPCAREYVVDRSGASGTSGGHYQASAPTTKGSMKVQTSDFDFDFDSAFKSAPKSQSKPGSLIEARVKPQYGSLMTSPEISNPSSTSTSNEKIVRKMQSSHLTAGGRRSQESSSLPLGRKDLSTAKAISAQDFEDDNVAAETKNNSTDFTRFKSASAISSDAFFGNVPSRGSGGLGGSDDEAATRLGIYHDRAVQKAADIAMAAQETFKSAAGWFNRVAQSSNSGPGY